jgi:hypothetical protein
MGAEGRLPLEDASGAAHDQVDRALTQPAAEGPALPNGAEERP